MSEKVEEGVISSKRKIIEVGDSKAVTLPKKWLDFHKYKGEEINEVSSLANDIVMVVPEGKEKKAKRILKRIEEEGSE